jgi:hypothetical protein
MSVNVTERFDLIAQNMEKVPDEAYVSLSAASIFSSIGLYLTGHRDEALFVGMLGTAFATMAGMMKIIGAQRGHGLAA